MRSVFRRINPILVMSIIVRLFIVDLIAWVVFQNTAHSAVTVVAFIVGGTMLSCGVGLRVNRPQPVPSEQTVQENPYAIPLSDQGSNALL